jgi:hypothetical protein
LQEDGRDAFMLAMTNNNTPWVRDVGIGHETKIARHAIAAYGYRGNALRGKSACRVKTVFHYMNGFLGC